MRIPAGPIAALVAAAVLVAVILWLLLSPIATQRPGVARVQRPPLTTVSAVDPRIGTFDQYYLNNDANPFVPKPARLDEQRRKQEIRQGPAKPAPKPPAPPPPPPDKKPLPRLPDGRALMPTVAGILRGVDGGMVTLRFPEAAQALGLPAEVDARPGDTLAGWTLIRITPSGLVELRGPNGQTVLLPPPTPSAIGGGGDLFPDPGVISGRSTTSGARPPGRPATRPALPARPVMPAR
jgi:hypothetical protein